jgi:hypothetical protein
VHRSEDKAIRTLTRRPSGGDQLIGTDFSDHFTEPRKARNGDREAFDRGFVTDYPLTIRHRDGRLAHVLYNAPVYQDTKQNGFGVFSAARDLMAPKQTEAEVTEQRANEMDKLAELERFPRPTVGSELKMIELKKELNDLRCTMAPEQETL